MTLYSGHKTKTNILKGSMILMLLFLQLSLLAQIEKILPPAPNPPRLVNDFTGTLTQHQIETLERKLVAYDDSTSNQVAVVIVSTLNDYDPYEYATALGRAWGVGNKGFNNGVVFLIAKDDRKVFIAAGYGLEGALPDIILKRIIENDVVPNFRGNDYFRGVDEGSNSIIKAAEGEYAAPEGYAERGRSGKGGPGGAILLFIILLIIIYFISRKGGGGRGGGGYVSRRGYRGWNNAPPIVFFPSGGGGFGGGGGGFGGGGFGGFGGGGFGGGGAGGSW